jgi:hypothetical protein
MISGRFRINGIVERIEQFEDLPISVVRLQVGDEVVSMSRDILVYLDLDQSLVGREIRILTTIGKDVKQSVLGEDYNAATKIGFNVLRKYYEELEARGYRINL